MKSQNFSMGQYHVDISRSNISCGKEVFSIEPKVLHVLSILARNQGEVVSHETLLKNVWPGMVVTPSALQRCIAQLRKVFKDNAKSPLVIATQPKIGYSLLLEVNWLEAETSAEMSFLKQPHSLHQLIVVASVLGLILLLFWFFNKKPDDLWVFKTLTPLTATDNRELLPSFSPDGRYIAFQRYIKACERQLWAKDLAANKEYLLTAQSGYFGQPKWSPDGQQIMFTDVEQCGQIKPCRDLKSVTFALAKVSPQVPQSHVACLDRGFGSISWLSNQELAVVVKSLEGVTVNKLHLVKGEFSPLYTPEKGMKPYHLSFSFEQQKLMIMQHDPLFNSHLMQLDLSTLNESSHLLQVPDQFHNQLWWRPNWHPNNNSLVTSYGRNLFEVSINGNMQAHPLFILENISNPVFHPDGERMAATIGTVDTDVSLFDWSSNIEQTKIIHRSTAGDYGAQFRPGSDSVAFISERSGSPQIWLSDHGKTIQISHLSIDMPVHSFVWSKDGQLLVLVAGSQLHVLNLAGELASLVTEFKVFGIYQALNDQRFLINTVAGGNRALMTFNINNKQQDILFNGFVSWAQIDDLGILYFIAADKEVYLQKEGQVMELPGLEGLKTTRKIHLNNKRLYVFTEQQQLLAFNTNDNTHQMLFDEMPWVDDLEDIRFDSQQILFTAMVSQKEEVVMLTP